MLLAPLVHAGNTVERGFEGLQDWGQEGAFVFEYPGHEATQWNDKRGEDREIYCDLNPAICTHAEFPRFSESLGAQQRVNQINHQPRGHETGKRIVEQHQCFLKGDRMRTCSRWR